MAFPSAPTITSEMRKGAQNLDVRTLQLSYLECNPPLRRAFSKVAYQISGYGESETLILEKIRLWHPDGNCMAQIPRTNIKGILVPTTHYIRSLEKKKISALMEMEEEIKPMQLQYQMHTHNDLDDYFEENPGTGPSHMFDFMESFHRLTPMARSLGGISFTCPCSDGFRCVACCHSTLFSALWDPKLWVSKHCLITLLPKRVTKKMPTAFEYPDKCARDKDKDKAKTRPRWHSVIANAGNSYSSSVSSNDPTEGKRSKGPVQACQPKTDKTGTTQVPTRTLSIHFFMYSLTSPTPPPPPPPPPPPHPLYSITGAGSCSTKTAHHRMMAHHSWCLLKGDAFGTLSLSLPPSLSLSHTHTHIHTHTAVLLCTAVCGCRYCWPVVHCCVR
jgi:hypothetical protein